MMMKRVPWLALQMRAVVTAFALAALACTLTFASAHAQQVPIPTTAAEVPGPAPGTAMTKAYVQTVGRMAALQLKPRLHLKSSGEGEAAPKIRHGSFGSLGRRFAIRRPPQTLTGWDHSQPVFSLANVVFSVIEVP